MRTTLFAVAHDAGTVLDGTRRRHFIIRTDTAEDLVFAVRGLGEAQAAYLQKLIEVCGACDALCECRAARVEETDALRRLPPKLLRELWEKGVCIRNLGRALASGAFLYDARNIRKRGTEHETHGETQ